MICESVSSGRIMYMSIVARCLYHHSQISRSAHAPRRNLERIMPLISPQKGMVRRINSTHQHMGTHLDAIIPRSLSDADPKPQGSIRRSSTNFIKLLIYRINAAQPCQILSLTSLNTNHSFQFPQILIKNQNSAHSPHTPRSNSHFPPLPHYLVPPLHPLLLPHFSLQHAALHGRHVPRELYDSCYVPKKVWHNFWSRRVKLKLFFLELFSCLLLQEAKCSLVFGWLRIWSCSVGGIR